MEKNYEVLVIRFDILYEGTRYNNTVFRRLDLKERKPYPDTYKLAPVTDNNGLRHWHDTDLCLVVDGGWTEEVRWNVSAPCGEVTAHWTRLCENPAPSNGGADCQGAANYTTDQSLAPCPIQAEWAEWSSWSSCSHSCGLCTSSRSRECIQDGDPYCEGSEQLDGIKGYETAQNLHATPCDTDCQTDEDCRGFSAVCEGTPKQCRFPCRNSLNCAHGLCTTVTRESNGDVLPLCLVQCDELYNHCPLDQICLGGRCRTKCSSDPTCQEPDEHCSSTNGVCTPSCLNHRSCRELLGQLASCFQLGSSDKEECVVGCTADSGCIDDNFTCSLGVCVSKGGGSIVPNIIRCESDKDCPQTVVCSRAGECIDPYHPSHSCDAEDFHCGPTAECKDGKCNPLYNFGKPCKNHSDCSYLERCMNGYCKVSQGPTGQVVTPISCESGCPTAIYGSVCSGDNRCQCPIGYQLRGYRLCVSEENPDENVAICGGEGQDYGCSTRCSGTQFCPDNEICHHGICHATCQEGATSPYALAALSCESHLTCTENICRKKCTSDDHCFELQRCLKGACHYECETATDCMKLFACSGGICTLQCNSRQKCKVGFLCHGRGCHVACSSTNNCASNQNCVLGICTSGCELNGCASGQICTGGTCATTCSVNQDCRENWVCSKGVCSPSCTSDVSCGQGWSCTSGSCVSPCNSKDDCHPSQLCISGYCKAVIGEACTENEDCNEIPEIPFNRCEDNVCVVDYRPGGECTKSSDCGQVALCTNYICTWPEDNSGKFIKVLPVPTGCVGINDPVCNAALPGSVCLTTDDGTLECRCPENYRQNFVRCLPDSVCK